MLLDADADAEASQGISGVIYAISIAARRGDREIACLLFSKVSDMVAAQTLMRNKGLQYAARGGWSDLVQQLIDESPRDADGEHTTTAALCQAAAAGSLETKQVLYENRANSTVLRDELEKAVDSAARQGYSLVVKYLQDRGADIGSQEYLEALVRAAAEGHLSTVQVLLAAGVNLNSRLSFEWRSTEAESYRLAAVERKQVEVACLLLAVGADPDTQYFGHSVLITSIKKANEELFDLLQENGASTAIIQPRWLKAGLEADSTLIADGCTALFHAAKAGHEGVLRILIHDYRADVHRHANKGTVAIHTAVFHNHSQCIEVFLNAGLDVNVRGRNGRTSLHWAAQEGSIDAVRVLLEKGANVFIEDTNTGMTAADIATVKVRESWKSQDHWWKGPCEDNYEPIVKMLVEQAAHSQDTPILGQQH